MVSPFASGDAVEDARDAEIENLDAIVGGDEHVLRFQIPMNDAFIVRLRQAGCDLRRVLHRLAHGQRAGRQRVAQRPPVKQLGDDVGDAIVGADVEDADDVRVVERGGRQRFLLKTAQARGIGGEFRW